MIDLRRQLFDPNYSAIKTTVTDLLDTHAESRRPRVRAIVTLLDRIVPDSWGNWFSEKGPHVD